MIYNEFVWSFSLSILIMLLYAGDLGGDIEDESIIGRPANRRQGIIC